MELSGDELAGIADQFDALPPAAMRRAIRETAFRAGEEVADERIESWIDDALAEFTLLEIELDGEPYVVPGPRSFPTVPDAASDLVHVLDVEPRAVPGEALETGVRKSLANAAEEIEDPVRAQDLLDVTYDAEAWVGTDLSDVRTRLEALAAEQES